MKVDQNFGSKHRVFFRHASNDRTELRSTNGIKGAPGEDGPLPLKRINDAYVLDWVGTMSPTFIANLRVSISRYVEGSRGDANAGFDLASFGFPASLVSQIPGGAFFGRYEFSGYSSLGRYYGFNYTNTFAMQPNVTKIYRAHSLHGGVDVRWIQYDLKNAGNPFRLTADRGFTQKEYNRGDNFSGNSIATWLLGTPSGGGADYNAFPTYLYEYFAPYIQDDWKVTPRLTLNLGLRWDFNISADERYNRMDRGFDPAIVNPADKLIDRTKFPGFSPLDGGLLFAGVNGVPRRATNLDPRDVQPRCGFALELTRKLVMRGGWGRYFLNPDNSDLQSNGFSQSTPLINSLDGERTAVPGLLSNPFPGGVQVPPGSSLGPLTFLGRGFSFINPNFKIPYVNQFSYGFQYELPSQSKVEVSYVGSRTHNLQTTRAFDEPDLAMRQKCDLMEGGNPFYCDQLLSNPFQGVAPFAGTSRFTASGLSRWDLSRPYPAYGGLTEVTRNDGAVWYNSMQVTFEKRSRAGLNLLATYTLSKQIYRSGFNDVERNIMQEGLSVGPAASVHAGQRLPVAGRPGQAVPEQLEPFVEPRIQRLGEHVDFPVAVRRAVGAARQCALRERGESPEHRLVGAAGPRRGALRRPLERQRHYHHAALQRRGRLHRL